MKRQTVQKIPSSTKHIINIEDFFLQYVQLKFTNITSSAENCSRNQDSSRTVSEHTRTVLEVFQDSTRSVSEHTRTVLEVFQNIPGQY